ncbi:MAG TPA: hypothetical protein VNL35_18740 [Chloroflexota bacterium]|nr:hypothetical protein [Chloroflexota bacterium]
MKLLIEILLSVFLHPIAMVLMWISVLRRGDLGFVKKGLWILVGIIWGVGPILYLLLGDGTFW